MRRFSYFILAFGAALGTVLFFLRRTRWFALEQAQTMSEPTEFIEAGFRASLILVLFGLILFALSFRPARRQADEIEAPAPLEPEPWICPACGSANRSTDAVCPVCGKPQGSFRRDWVCPRCGSVIPAEAEECSVCGFRE